MYTSLWWLKHDTHYWRRAISGGSPYEPLMVARIHAGNAGNNAYAPETMAAHPDQWQRVPEWDAYCKGVFA